MAESMLLCWPELLYHSFVFPCFLCFLHFVCLLCMVGALSDTKASLSSRHGSDAPDITQCGKFSHAQFP